MRHHGRYGNCFRQVTSGSQGAWGSHFEVKRNRLAQHAKYVRYAKHSGTCHAVAGCRRVPDSIAGGLQQLLAQPREASQYMWSLQVYTGLHEALSAPLALSAENIKREFTTVCSARVSPCRSWLWRTWKLIQRTGLLHGCSSRAHTPSGRWKHTAWILTYALISDRNR